MLKIIFFGTPSFVVPIAESLLQIPDSQLVAVVTNPDRPVGRKQILTPSPIKSWALEHKISIFTPEKLDQNFLNILVSQYPNLDLGVLAAYGKIIPQEIIDLFPKGILVIHPSLLPKYRGASPIQTAILNGDKVTGVSIIQMDSKMDHGPIVYQFKEEISEEDTSETLTERLFLKTAEILPTIVSTVGVDPPQPQNHSLATFTKLLKKEDGFIEWKTLASQGESLRSYNFIRAMTPWPGAFTNVKLKMQKGKLERRLKILKAHLENGNLILNVVQLEGKKPISWQEFSKRLA